jgi:hypothetical protein
MALTAPNKHDLDARLSYISSTSKAKDGEYKAADTPDIEGGALREGGPPVLTSRDNIGLLFQYAAVGLTYGVMPATIYPFLQQYLNTSGTQVTVATQLVVFPWSFKAFYGALSDCVPIFGLRRKPYMLIGWTICIAMMLVMACMPAGDPYFTISADRDIKPADYTPEIRRASTTTRPTKPASTSCSCSSPLSATSCRTCARTASSLTSRSASRSRSAARPSR